MDEADLIIECSVCTKKLRVPASSRGKKFRCPGCKSILSSEEPEEPEEEEEEDEPQPEAPVEPPPPEVTAPSKPRPKGKGKKKTARPRASRKPSRSRKKADEPSGGGSKLPLLIAVVVLLLVGGLAAGGVVLFSGAPEPAPRESDGDGDEGESGDTSETDGPAEPKEVELTPAEKERREKETALLRDAARALTAEAYKTCGDRAQAMGLTAMAKTLWRLAVERNLADDLEGAVSTEDLEALYPKLGYRKYELPAEARDWAKEAGMLEALKPHDGKWLSPQAWERVKAIEPAALRLARTEYRKRQDDPVYGKTQALKAKLRTQRGFRDFIFGHVYDDPYLVLDERGRKGQKLDDADEIEFLSRKKVRMLRSVYRFVKKEFMDPLGIEQKNKEPMVAIQFANRGTFLAYNNAIGMRVPPGALAYFSRLNTFIFMYDSPGSTPEELDHQDGILFHEATHQIVSAFLNPAGRAMFGRVNVSHWFNEGIAEYVGSSNRKEDDEGEIVWVFGCKNPGRIDEFYRALNPKKFKFHRDVLKLKKPYAMTLQEMVKCHYPRQVINTVMRKFGSFPGRFRVQVQSTASSLVYAQASFLLYYCFRGPKKDVYGPCLQKYAAMEFQGKGGWAAFQAAFKGVDLAALEKGWVEHLDALTPDHVKRGN